MYERGDMKQVGYDTETCGFYGLACLIQYGDMGKDVAWDAPISLHSPWAVKVDETLELIEWLMQQQLVAFNMTFDHFHLQKLYTTFYLLKKKLGNVIPEGVLYDTPDVIWECEQAARDVDICLKPAGCIDLMLVGKAGKLQGLMERKNITIRRVPTQLALGLQEELNNRVTLPDIYFARKQDKDIRFQLDAIDDRPDLKNVTLRFRPSGRLKDLILHMYPDEAGVIKYDEVDPITLYGDRMKPVEVGFAPYTLAANKKLEILHRKREKLDRHTQSVLLERYIGHWQNHEQARKYAANDVRYLRMLGAALDNPTETDNNSRLASMVGSVRWRGFAVDLDKIDKLRAEALDKMKAAPRAANAVKKWLLGACDDIEAVGIIDTSKPTLISLTEWECVECDGVGGEVNEAGDAFVSKCQTCEGSGKHPVAERADKVMRARAAANRVDMYNKIQLAGRFHASLKVIGTKSSRMSGGDGLNPQGIPHDAEIRESFPLAWPGMKLFGGDFDAFEVGLLDAVYDDPKLREVLLSGKKIHTLMAQAMFPGMTYEEITASKGAKAPAIDYYTKGKNGVFSLAYFGDENTLIRKYNVAPENARAAFDNFMKDYEVLGKKRLKIIDDYSCVTQPKGIGTQVVWKEPETSVTAHTGFTRYFDLEYAVCREIYKLAQNIPKAWHQIEGFVTRREEGRQQRMGGAVQSALYGAVFGIQGQCVRAAGNHYIQCFGAEVTKDLQVQIWETQPVGVEPFKVLPLNVHDELMCPCKPEVEKEVADIVTQVVEGYRPTVPLIGFDWGKLESWGEK